MKKLGVLVFTILYSLSSALSYADQYYGGQGAGWSASTSSLVGLNTLPAGTTKYIRAGQTISRVARGSNIVTITLSANYPNGNLKSGQKIVVDADDNSFDGTFTITGSADLTHFTYSQTGSDVAEKDATGTAGGDYSSLTAWEAAVAADLVSGNSVAVAECYNDWASGLNDNLVIDGHTTDETHYIKIVALPGECNTGSAGSGFRIAPSSGDAITIGTGASNVWLQGIEVTRPTLVQAGTTTTDSGCIYTGGITVSSGATLKLSGKTFTTFGTATLNSGSTIEYLGPRPADSPGAVTLLNTSHHHLTLSSAAIFNVPANNFDINGNLTINSPATLYQNNYNFTVAGNWQNSGYFTASNNTVTLDGTSQVISGSSTFYNLTKSVAAADTLTFTAGSTQVVSNTLSLGGASNQLLSLRSSSSGSQWNITMNGTASVSYVDVKDSNASSGKTIVATYSTDSLNNLNWNVNTGNYTKTWTGTTSTAWATDTNWSPSGAPGSSDGVLIPSTYTNAPTLTTATTIASLGINTGATLTFNNNTDPLLTVTGDVRMSGSSTITHTANSNSEAYKVNMSVGGNVFIEAGAAINTDAKGYAAGQGPGKTTAAVDGDSAHGGRGLGGKGPTYGSFTDPVNLGSGASSYGGGAIKISAVGTVTVNGSLSANANFWNSSSDGGGSGGSINISAGTFTGTGTVYANGGNNWTNGYKGGGGGRISFNGVTSFTFSGTILARGGCHRNTMFSNPGYSGTICFPSGMDLTLGGAGNMTSLTLGSDDTPSPYTFGAITINSGGTLKIDGNPYLNGDDGRGGAATINASSITVNSGGTLSSDSFGFRFDSVTVAAGIHSAGSYPTSSYGGRGNIRAFNGYASPGSIYNGTYYANSGATYGAIDDAKYLGSPASANGLILLGGGATILNVSGAVTVNGTISANGYGATGCDAAPSGGSVKITAGSLAGSGNIYAKGGYGVYHETGRGGGGRIDISGVAASTFSGIVAAGGSAIETWRCPAYAGTVNLPQFMKDNLTIGGANNISTLVLGTDDTATAYTFGNVTINSGGTLYISSNPSLNSLYGTSSVINAANITVNTGGTISASKSGFSGEYYNADLGVVPPCGELGIDYQSNPYRTYGGRCAHSNFQVYGSVTDPIDMGSGHNSGGSIRLNVSGTLTVNGTIGSPSSAFNSQYYGSGGSINIVAGTLSGSGTIMANGGNGGSASPNGGGGRIAVVYTTDNSSITFQAKGGIDSRTGYGSAGTIYKRQSAASYGNLIIDNGGNYQAGTLNTPILSSYQFQDVTAQNRGLLELGANMSVAGNFTINTNCSLVPNTYGVTLNGTGAQTVTTTTPASQSFYGLTVTNAGTSGVTFADSCTVTNSFTAVTPSTRLTFTGTKTYAFANPTINGQALDTKIAMRSSSSGSPWLFNYSGTQALAYVSVSDSNATGSAATVTPTSGTSSDGLGNTNWNFGTSTADRYWVGNGTSTSWNNTANWATTSGGSGGASVPGAANTVIFDARGTGDCTLDMAPTIASLINGGAYGGIFSTSTSNHNLIINGKMSWKAGTFNANNSTLTVTGDADFSGGTFTKGSSTVVFTGTGKTWTPGTNSFAGITIGTGSTIDFNVSGTADVTGTLTLNTGTGKVFGGTINLSGSSLIGTSGGSAGNGNATTVINWTGAPASWNPGNGYYPRLKFNTNGVTTTLTGNLNAIAVEIASGVLNAGSNTITLTSYYTSNGVAFNVTAAAANSFVPGTGTITFSGPVNRPISQSNSAAATYNNMILNASGYGKLFAAGITYTVNGDLTLNCSPDSLLNGTIALNGNLIMNSVGVDSSTVIDLVNTSSPQTITCAGNYMPPLALHKSGQTATISGATTLDNVTITSGTLTFAPGYTYTVRATKTITVASGAKLRLMGTGSGDKVTMVSSTPGSTRWNLANAAGSLVSPIWVDVSDSNATNPVYATDSSSTGGNNVNWNFGSTGNRYWVASSDGVWSDPANWSTTSGGAGGAPIPGTSDTAIFNSARSGNCTLDISPVITAITNAAGSAYTGTLDMNGYSLTVSGNLQWDGGTLTGGSGTLSVTGNLTQAGGSFTTPAGGTTLKTNLTRTGGTFTNTGNTITFDNALATQRSTVSMGGVLGGTVVINKTLGGGAPDYFTVASGTTINLGANPTTTLNANDCGIMNNGTIIIASGVWTLNGLGSNPAKLTNNGTITHSGNGWDLNSVRLTNTGTITYAGTGITMTGSFTQTGTFDLTGKTVTFDRTAAVVNDSTATVTANGSLGGTVVISRGTGGSNFIVANGTSINLGDNPTTELGSNGSGIINNGTIVVPSGTWAINNVGNVNAALFVNNGTITHSGNGFNLNGTSLTNEGTISYSGTSILISVNFIQNGTFDLAGKTITFYTSPLSTNATGSTISGSSHIGANIIVNKSNASHQMTLGSSVSIGGDFTLTRGTLNVYYDLTIAGNMSIASGNTVNLNQASPVQPVSLILGKGLSNSGTINVGSGGTDVNRSTIKSSSTAYITVTGGSVSANCDYCFFEYAAISGVTNSGAATVQAVTNDINGGGGDQGTTGAGGWNWGSCPSGKIWDGGGSTNNWSEAANWSGDTVPTGTDEVIFGSTSAKDCAINSLGSWSNGKVSIGAGYSGTVTLGVTAMTIGTFAQAGGTFTCGANNLNINGASNFSGGTFNGGSGTHVISASGGSNTFTLSGGTFNASSGNTTFRSTFTQTAGTFNDCDGTVIISPSGCNPTMDVPTSITFNNLTREAGYGVTISADGDTWIVDGALALNGTGAFSGGTIDANGSISIASTFGGGTTILLVNGAGDQSFTIPNGATLCGLTLNSIGTTVDFADGAIAGIGGSLTIQAGTFIASSGTTRFNGHSASFVHTVGGVFDHNDGTWIFGNLNSNNSFGSDVFNNVQFDFSYNSFTISSGPLTVNGTLTLTDATIYGGTIDAKGAVSMGPSFDGGTVAFSLTGTGTQAFTIASGAAMPTGTLTVNKDSDTATITGTTSAAKPMHNINVAKGTLTFGPGTYYIDDADVISVGTGASAAALNFTGTSPSNMVVLRSDTTAQWDLTKGANGTVNAQYVDVQYSAASAQVNAYDSINSGNNNANWIFPAATLSSWALDMNAKTLTLNFSNGVDSSSVLPGLFTLQNLSSSPTATYTLTDSSTSSVDGSTIVLDLTTTDFNAIVNTPGLCRQSDRSDSYLSMSAGVVDMATGAAVATVSGLQAASYTADTTVATKFRVITTGGAGQTTYTAGNGSGIGIKIRSYNDAGYRCPSYAADKTLVFSGASAAPKSQYIPTARDKTSSNIEFGSNTVVTFTYGEGASTLMLYCKAPSGAPALIAATDSGNSVSTDPVYRLQVTVNPMTKSEVYFSQQPSATATINDPFAIQPVVTIRDMYGNRTDGDTDNITLYDSESDQTYSDAVGDISATSNPLAATDSTAAFSGVEFDTIGEVYLRAVASGLTPAFSTMITLFAGATSSVTVADSPTVNFNLIPTYDTLGERFAALKFKVTDTGDDAIATKIDRIKIAVGGTGASASTDIAWAGLYKGAVEVATATGAAITNSDITFGVTPNSNNTADLDSVADATATEYTLYIYMKSSKLTATDTQTYTFDTDSSLVGTDTGLSSQMKTQDDNNVAAVTGTVTVDVTHFEIVSQVTGNSSVTMSAGSTAELRIRAIDGNKNVDIHYGLAPGEIKSLKFSGLASIGGNNPKIENTAFGSNINVEFVSGVSTAGAVTLTAYAREVADVSVLENGRAPALTVFPLTATVNALSGSALAYVSGNNQTGIINNNLSSSLVARVTDTYGNNVTGHTVSFEVFSYPDGATGYSVTPGSPATDANGLAATTVRLGNVGGAYTVRASAVDGSMNPLAGSPVSFSATATQPTALVQMSGHVPQQSATVGQVVSNPFVVKLQDSGNQGVPGETVSFSITSYPGGATGQSVSDPTDVTDGTGQASTTLTLGNKTGDYTVRATYTGVTPNLTADFTATATAGATYKAVLTGPASVNAGTPSTAFTISIKDQYDNPATVTVTPMQFSLSTNPSLGTFYSDSGCTAGNEITAVSVAAGANTAVFYYKSNTVGTTDVTATTTDVRLNAGFRTSTVTAFSVIPADLHHFTVTASDMSTMSVAGSRTITIRAYDANNNLRTNYTDSMNIVFSGASASPSPAAQPATADGTAFGTNTSISFNAGVATAAFVPYKAETTLIKATFGVVTTADPDALSLNVRHGAVDHLKLHDNLASPQTAGTHFNFDTTLDAVDRYDNICDGLNGASAYSESDRSITWTYSGTKDGPESGTDVITSTVSFTSGRSTTALSATLYRAQDTTLTADIAALPKVVGNRASNTITVNAADIERMTFSPEPSDACVTSQILAQQPRIILVDQYGNACSNKSAQITLAGSTTTGTFTAVTNGALTPSQNLVVSTSGGIATFSSLTYNYPEGIYLRAQAGSVTGGITLGDVYSRMITFSAANELATTDVAGASATVPSIANLQADKVEVLKFRITDGGTDGLAGVIKKIVINRDAGVDTTGGWLNYISDAYITDGTTQVLGSIDDDTLTFGTGSATIYSVSNNSLKNFTVSVNLKTSLPVGADGKVLSFKLTAANDITLGVPATSGLSAATIANSPTLTVAATKLVVTAVGGYTTMNAGVGKEILIRAKDVNNNIDLDFDDNKAITFGGASVATSGTKPTCTNYAGVAKDFGTGTDVTFLNGESSSTITMILYKAETAVVTATDSGGPTTSGADRLTVIVSGGSASQLSWYTQPKDHAVANAAWAPFVVAVTDAYGNTASDNREITVTPSAGVTLTTPLTNVATASSGLASFSSFAVYAGDDTYPKIVSLVASAAGVGDSVASANVTLEGKYTVTFNVKDSVNATALTGFRFSATDADTGDPVITETTKNSPFSLEGSDALPAGHYNFNFGKDLYVDLISEKTAGSAADGEDGVYDNAITWTIYMTTISEATADYKTMSSFVYDEDSETLNIRLWLERRGKMIVNSDINKIGTAVIEAYEPDGTALDTIVLPTKINEGNTAIDATFIKAVTGMLDADNEFGKALTAGKTYFVKCTINYGGTGGTANAYEAGTTFTVTVMQKMSQEIISKLGVGEGETLAGKIETVGAAVTIVSGKIDTIEGKIDGVSGQVTTVGSAVSGVSGQVSSVQSSASAILENVQTTLPAKVKTELEKGVMSEMLTRNTVMRVDDAVKIRYRTATGLAPKLTIYSPDGTAITDYDQVTMTEISTTGIYEYEVTATDAWGDGDFTVVCSEETKGSTDSMTITIKPLFVAGAGVEESIEAVGDAVTKVYTRQKSIEGILGSAADKRSQVTIFGRINTLTSTVDGLNLTTVSSDAKNARMNAQNIYSIIQSLTGSMGDIKAQAAAVKHLSSQLDDMRANLLRITKNLGTYQGGGGTTTIVTGSAEGGEGSGEGAGTGGGETEALKRATAAMEKKSAEEGVNKEDFNAMNNRIEELTALVKVLSRMVETTNNKPIVEGYFEQG